MDTAAQSYATLQEEFEAVRAFLSNEAFKYQDKLSWDCSMDPDVDATLVVPKRLIQTFVETAITHELVKNVEGGKIEASIHRSKLGVLIMVTDNGADPAESPWMKVHRQERLKILDCYLDLFNKQYPYTIRYQVLNRSEGEPNRTGSRVVITIYQS